MASESLLQLGSHQYDPHQQKLTDSSGQESVLRPQSLQVLQLLASKPNQVVTKDEIFATVWKEVSVTDDSLVQCIGDIRRALGDSKYKVLQTVPRRGYKLVTTTISPKPVPRSGWQRIRQRPRSAGMLLLGVLAFALLSFLDWQTPAVSSSADKSASTLSVTLLEPPASAAKAASAPRLNALLQEIRVNLGHYRNVRLIDDTPTAPADYQLKIGGHGFGDGESAGQVTLELKNSRDTATILAESYSLTVDKEAVQQVAVRAAAEVASPGVGAIGLHLLSSSRLKPVEELTATECYAYGYGCTKCSGEEDNIDQRANACVDNLLKADPEDAKAWALKATLLTHQYWFGTTLPEPERSTLALRRHLPAEALAAANKAEALARGGDSAVYWGMAEAYMASCQSDKLYTTVKRGLEINPNDPNLLASFGNWLAYSGYWEEGAAMTQQALAIEPQRYKHWWLMSVAKNDYRQGNYSQAYEWFMQSFNERNWLSHLQLAYTLPYLGRLDEAKVAVQELQKHSPGFTLENAVEFYKTFCFDDEFLARIKRALVLAGLPSRGDSVNFNAIKPPAAKTIAVNGINIEYMDVGQGEPVLFVHGSISDYRTWSHYLLPISDKHRYISYSQRYFGNQPWADNGEKWSPDTFVADLIGFIEALQIGPVHLVSWSSSGPIVGLAAIQRPDLIKSVTSYEPVTNDIMEGDAEAKPLMDQWLSPEVWGGMFKQLKAGDTQRAGELMLENVFELPPGGFEDETEITQELVRHNARTLPLRFGPQNKSGTKITCDVLQQTTVPTLIVLGEKTHRYWALMAKKSADCTPGARFEIMKGVNHKGPILKVGEFSDLILQFVDAHK